MTHYKNHWMQLGVNRLKSGERFIIDISILASFLCYCLNILGNDFVLSVTIKSKKATMKPIK